MTSFVQSPSKVSNSNAKMSTTNTTVFDPLILFRLGHVNEHRPRNSDSCISSSSGEALIFSQSLHLLKHALLYMWEVLFLQDTQESHGMLMPEGSTYVKSFRGFNTNWDA